MKKIYLLGGLLAAIGIIGIGNLALKTFRIYNIPFSTVMITNNDGDRGGSGSILSSSSTLSAVLTNRHVCKLLSKGGKVNTYAGTYYVSNYIISSHHDLCLVFVAADLHASTSLASAPPAMFEDATVSGHPRLLPTIITKGHFSAKKIIAVLIDVKRCSPDDLEDPAMGIFCQILGYMPIIEVFESQVVSALIQPGSSGSAIYNSSGEIAAVVFAGSGDLGFAYAVPYEYLNNFLTVELDTEVIYTPGIANSSVPAKADSLITKYKQMLRICEKAATDKVKAVCDKLKSSVVLEDDL